MPKATISEDGRDILQDTAPTGEQMLAESNEALRRAYDSAVHENIWLREEVIFQTGCTPEQLAECMAVEQEHRNVVNVRMDAEVMKRLELGEEVRLLRDVATGARMALNNDFCHFMVRGLLRPPLNALREWGIANARSEEEYRED